MTKLNIGCGSRRLAGYIGIDAIPRPAADMVAPAWAIPLPDNSVDEIISLHLWEHFYRWECDAVMHEWRRLLKPDGLLVLELPNLLKCCQNILTGKVRGGKDPNQLGYWGLFGDPREKDPFMSHRWGWTPSTLSAFLKEHGFYYIREEETQWHPAGRTDRDMRFTARKAPE